MGNKTKIDWCDSSWNPVTGCLHGCEYCYARGIAKLYGGYDWRGGKTTECFTPRRELTEPLLLTGKDGVVRKAAYPYGFEPTLHRYRLEIPARWTKPRNIFVCSMADLFGKWVPDEWIREVFEACKRAPQHRYLFLTKNPIRYLELAKTGTLPKKDNFFYGATATHKDSPFWWADEYKTFISVEPILEPFDDLGNDNCFTDWIIVGAETGNRRGKVIPKKDWIDELSEACKRTGTPIFMKESLRILMGEDFRQEYPWEVQA